MSPVDPTPAQPAALSVLGYDVVTVAVAFRALAALAVTTLSLVALLPQTDVIAIQAMLA